MANSKLLAAALGGAAAGAILGLLLAPQAGSETRKQLMKATRRSSDMLDDLIEDGKKSWFETKNKAEAGAGVAVDELDDFIRHILNKGQVMWKKAQKKGRDLAEEGEDALATTMSNGKKAANNVKERAS